MASHHPLHDADAPNPTPGSLEVEMRLTREYLDQVADANILDHNAMVKAAAGLDYRLRALLAAIDAERGTQ